MVKCLVHAMCLLKHTVCNCAPESLQSSLICWQIEKSPPSFHPAISAPPNQSEPKPNPSACCFCELMCVCVCAHVGDGGGGGERIWVGVGGRRCWGGLAPSTPSLKFCQWNELRRAVPNALVSLLHFCLLTPESYSKPPRSLFFLFSFCLSSFFFSFFESG